MVEFWLWYFVLVEYLLMIFLWGYKWFYKLVVVVLKSWSGVFMMWIILLVFWRVYILNVFILSWIKGCVCGVNF